MVEFKENEKALELDNRIFFSYSNIEISPKNATKHMVKLRALMRVTN